MDEAKIAIVIEAATLTVIKIVFGIMEYIRVGIEIVLLVLYVIYFGINSVNKYLTSGVIITRDEEPSSNISPPGKSI